MWVDHIFCTGVRYSYRCPSAAKYLFDAYSAYGRLKLGLALMNGEIPYSPKLLDIIYKCTLCGACDAGCKRNLDLEPLLTLEALRIKCIEEGKGLPEHRRIAENVIRFGNPWGFPPEKGYEVTETTRGKEKTVTYFIGCHSNYLSKEIANATIKILKTYNQEFSILNEKMCCGYPLYSTGRIKDFRRIVDHNLKLMRHKNIIVHCAQCYKTFKVDYPKVLGKSTADMDYKVIHLAEWLEQLLEKGILKFNREVRFKAVYHDPCNLARLSEPWIPWEGERAKWGCLVPPKKFRRGADGIYEPPRSILKSIPGLELIEMPRNRENSWCCGGGGGVEYAFKDFALWTAKERVDEAKEVGAEAIITCCPHCRSLLQEAAKLGDKKIKVFDLSEILLKALGGE